MDVVTKLRHFALITYAVAPERIAIVTARGQRRAVLSLGYDGGRQ